MQLTKAYVAKMSCNQLIWTDSATYVLNKIYSPHANHFIGICMTQGHRKKLWACTCTHASHTYCNYTLSSHDHVQEITKHRNNTHTVTVCMHKCVTCLS